MAIHHKKKTTTKTTKTTTRVAAKGGIGPSKKEKQKSKDQQRANSSVNDGKESKPYEEDESNKMRIPKKYPPHLLSDAVTSSFQPKRLNNLIGNVAFTALDFFTPKECDDWIAFGESYGFDPINSPQSKDMAHRECGQIILYDWKMADRLYERMKVYLQKMDFTGTPVTCNGEKMQLYRYRPGMEFTRHIDIADPIREYPNGYTDMTVLIYLSDDCDGGATRFYPEFSRKKRLQKPVAFGPTKGAILFHAHGDRCLEHDSEEVKRGTKYVLRTDIVCVPN